MLLYYKCIFWWFSINVTTRAHNFGLFPNADKSKCWSITLENSYKQIYCVCECFCTVSTHMQNQPCMPAGLGRDPPLRIRAQNKFENICLKTAWLKNFFWGFLIVSQLFLLYRKIFLNKFELKFCFLINLAT